LVLDAFWAVSLCNADGYFEKNPYNAYSVNSITGKGTDGSIASWVPAMARFRIACRPRQAGGGGE
jgi:hypothetical protein